MKADLYDSAYGNVHSDVLERVRRATYGEDIGQNSWTTADEYRGWAPWLVRSESDRVLEVASGSGGPAIFLARLTGAHVTGIEVNPHGIAAAEANALHEGLAERVRFEQADATRVLPFASGSFDALICVDAANHLPDRERVLGEWRRVLKPGGRLLWTDPVVITGPVTNEELALRSSIGVFVFLPDGANERLLARAGFDRVEREDTSEAASLVAGRRRDARAREHAGLTQIEGAELFAGLQAFLDCVHRLTGERRLSRIVYRCT